MCYRNIASFSNNKEKLNKQFKSINIGMMQRSIHTLYFTMIFSLFFVANCGSKDSEKQNNNKHVSTTTHQNQHKQIVQTAPKKKKLKTVKVAKVEERKQAIVLLHGLNRISYDFDIMKAALQKAFPYATIVALKCVDKAPKKWGLSLSMKLSIKEQAELSYQEIKAVLGRNRHVVILGHSQGGLRGFTIIKEYADKLKEELGITIEQLITIGTPWTGATVMDHLNDPNVVNQQLDDCKDTLEKIDEKYRKGIVRYVLKTSLAENFPFLVKYLGQRIVDTTQGAADLKRDSDFIQNYVQKGLKEINVPIKAIAGVLVDFSKLFDYFPSSISKQELEKLNRTYAKLIGGDPMCEHDMLLTVATQHAEGIDKKDFKCIKINDVCHGNKVGISVKKGIAELDNNKVIQTVTEITENVFYKKEQVEVEDTTPTAALGG